jgi:hypothetical protein
MTSKQFDTNASKTMMKNGVVANVVHDYEEVMEDPYTTMECKNCHFKWALGFEKEGNLYRSPSFKKRSQNKNAKH